MTRSWTSVVIDGRRGDWDWKVLEPDQDGEKYFAIAAYIYLGREENNGGDQPRVVSLFTRGDTAEDARENLFKLMGWQ